MAVGEAAEALDEEVDEAFEREGDDQDKDEAGQVVPGEIDEVGVPVAAESLDVFAFGGNLLLRNCAPEDDDGLAFGFGFVDALNASLTY